MKKINFVLSIIAAFLVFCVVPAQTNFAAEALKSSNSAYESEKKTMPHPGEKKFLVAYFSHSGTPVRSRTKLTINWAAIFLRSRP
mgnify:CR=1 FL=1